MSQVRAVSTIPRGDFKPQHQPQQEVDNWVYPSEQQYYNAMTKKGYNPSPNDVPAILFIHNHVNEEGWRKIREWEAFRGNDVPKLLRFQGRPTDLSPKARILNWLGYSLPFDRHDWFVDRNGKQIRYVIDFYRGASRNPLVPVSIFLDVRPACDSVPSTFDVISFYWRRVFKPNSLPSIKSSITSPHAVANKKSEDKK